MQEAVPVGKGAMAALIGADIETVRQTITAVNEELAGLPADTAGIRPVVNLANWNSATQIVISGEKSAVEEAARRLAVKTVFLPGLGSLSFRTDASGRGESWPLTLTG